MVLMGHGTEDHANAAYSILEAALCREGQNHILIGTVEGDPSLDTLCRRLLAEGVGRVRLMPLMLVAGDHAVNDMASEASGSWAWAVFCSPSRAATERISTATTQVIARTVFPAERVCFWALSLPHAGQTVTPSGSSALQNLQVFIARFLSRKMFAPVYHTFR